MVLILLLVALAPAFFYKLGQSSLVSWDEAWYAEVAKQVLHSGNIVVMRYNALVFSDHPPFGFWVMALCQRLWGIDEFGSRFGAAVFGLVTLVGVYLLGKLVWNRWVGWWSVVALFSSPWFLLRSRSGDLDIYVIAGVVWALVLAQLAQKSRAYFAPFVLVLALFLLTKTMVPWLILPALLVSWWGNLLYSRRTWVLAGVLVVAPFLWWAHANEQASELFWSNYWAIGTPGVGGTLDFWGHLHVVKDHLYNGIGRWFWPAFVACGLALFTFRKRYWTLLVAIGGLLAPFLFSERTRLWHLLPLQPLVLLVLFGLVYDVTKTFSHKKLAPVALGLMFLVIGVPQSGRNWREIVDVPAYISDEQILSEASRSYAGPLYIDDIFIPTAAFYSDKKIYRILGPLEELFDHEPEPYTMIVYKRRLDQVDRLKYPFESIATDRDKVLIWRKKRF